MRRARLLPIAFALAALAGQLPAGGAGAAAEDDLARRTLANADQLMREGKIEQALKDLEQIVSAYPATGVADDALYRMGQYYYPAETVDALGRASAAAIARARELFARIGADYPREDSAPRALLKLGLIALEPGNPQRSLDDAYAAFSRVVNIYPASDVVDRALFGAGFAHYEAGRHDRAATSFLQVAERFPDGPVAQESRYYMALALARQDAHIRALEEFQEVRNRHPEGRLAGPALDRLTQIFKLKLQPQLGIRPLFAHDASYEPALDPETLRGDLLLSVDGDSVLHLLDARSGAIRRLGLDGRLKSSGTPLPGASSIAIGQGDTEVLAAADRIRVGVETVLPMRLEAGRPQPLRRITAAVEASPGRLAFLDEERNEILLYQGDAAALKLLYRDPEGRARLAGLAAGASGRLYTIDRRSRRLIEVDVEGAFRHVPMPSDAEAALQEPAALAADDLGDLYVVDRRADAVMVMTTRGALLETIVSRPATPAEFPDPAAIAVGPRGEIYLYDARRRTILRFR